MSESEESLPKAFIDIDDVKFFSRIYFVKGGSKDFMGALWKNPGADEPWHFDYRFRYYRSERVFDSGDRRSEYRTVLQPGVPKAMVLKHVRELCNKVLGPGFHEDNERGGNVHELVLETSSTREIHRMMSREKWAHFMRPK